MIRIMLWSAVCRKRVLVTSLLAFLFLRLLVAVFNSSLQSIAVKDKQPRYRKDNQRTVPVQSRKRIVHDPIEIVHSKYDSDDPLSEITLSIADLDMIRRTPPPSRPNTSKGATKPNISDNVLNKFRYDANRALISKEDLQRKAKESDFDYIKKFLEKNLNKGNKELDKDAQSTKQKNNVLDDDTKSKDYKLSYTNKGRNGNTFMNNNGLLFNPQIPIGDKLSKTPLRSGLNPRIPKCKGYVFLLITVFSTPQNVEMRNAIRETWGGITHRPGYQTKVLFVTSRPQPNVFTKDLQDELENEKHFYRDILSFDFIDSHENLTLKSIHTLQWAERFCPLAKYILKTDEDVFINVPLLIQKLTTVSQSHFIMGHLIEKGQPLRDRRTRYYTPEEVFPGKAYPQYMSGTAYVISGDVIHDLNIAVSETKFFWLEDVYITGMCAAKVKITLIDSKKFNHNDKAVINPCLFRFLISNHGMHADSLRHAWKVLYSAGSECADTASHIIH